MLPFFLCIYMKNQTKYIAECIGTFALVFFGTGAIIVNQQTAGSLGLLGVSASFGIILMSMIYVFGNISGAHFNPAVTIALAIGKLIPKKEVLGYLIAQCIGAFIASGILSLLFPENTSLGATLPTGSTIQSFIIEYIATSFLMLTILGITSNSKHTHLAGGIIGILVVGLILFTGPISGGSFNPARSLAPAIISGNITSVWIYAIAPILGAISVTLLWNLFQKKEF